MTKQERIQAIEGIIQDNFTIILNKEELNRLATAIEEAIGVDVKELSDFLITMEGQDYDKEVVSYLKIIAKAISTNKEVIKINDNS